MRALFILLLAVLSLNGYAQERKHSLFYHQRASLFEKLPIGKKDIVMLGNSITNGCEWNELFPNKRLKNRGISGDIAQGVLDRLHPIIEGKPAKIFLLIGTNDIAQGISEEIIVNNIEKIILKTKEKSPKTKMFIQSILPTSPHFTTSQKYMQHDVIKKVNQALKALTIKHHITYIDLYSHFVEQGTDHLSPRYTNDGLHLTGEGYLLWKEIISPYL